jgi:hypothetical protein
MAIRDVFSRFFTSNNPIALIAPGRRHVVITPADSDLAERPRCLHFEADGTVAVVDEVGATVVYDVKARTELMFSPVQVKATGTVMAAGKIIGWY